MNTHAISHSSWSTASVDRKVDTSAMELLALGEHFARCQGSRVYASRRTEGQHSLARPHKLVRSEGSLGRATAFQMRRGAPIRGDTIELGADRQRTGFAHCIH